MNRNDSRDGGEAQGRPVRRYRKIGGSVPIPPMAALGTDDIVTELQSRFANSVVFLHAPLHGDDDEPGVQQYVAGNEFALIGMLGTIPQAVITDIRRSMSEAE